jgi:hypothetical protein
MIGNRYQVKKLDTLLFDRTDKAVGGTPAEQNSSNWVMSILKSSGTRSSKAVMDDLLTRAIRNGDVANGRERPLELDGARRSEFGAAKS